MSAVQSVRRDWGGTDDYGGTVSLTPLGRWLVHGILSTVADVPVAGSLAEVSADELLVRTADLPEDIAGLELEVWLQAHGDAATDLLIDALGQAGETGRSVAFDALFRLGPPTEEQVARLTNNPELSHYALIWRGHTLAAAPEELDVGGDGDLLVRVLNGVLMLWGPEVMTAWLGPASGATGAQAAVDSMWRVRQPDTEAVLMNLGEFHPDKNLAKAARKSLFKFRSSGGAPS